jgi:hypothetical protein
MQLSCWEILTKPAIQLAVRDIRDFQTVSPDLAFCTGWLRVFLLPGRVHARPRATVRGVRSRTQTVGRLNKR